MATIMQCDGPDDAQAVIVVQLIEDVEVLAFCPSCAADWAQAYLQAFDPSRLAAKGSAKARKTVTAAAAAVADDQAGSDGDTPPPGQ